MPGPEGRFGLSTLIVPAQPYKQRSWWYSPCESQATSYLGSAIAPLLLDGLSLCTVLMPITAPAITALAMRDVPSERARSA